jgi:hypothetical protein
LFELLGPHALESAITDRVKVNVEDRESSTVITIHIAKRKPNEASPAPETSVREFGHIILSGQPACAQGNERNQKREN